MASDTSSIGSQALEKNRPGIKTRVPVLEIHMNALAIGALFSDAVKIPKLGKLSHLGGRAIR